ncbi:MULTISPECIES: hypothetical protein [Acidiphilium]|uniref:High potential iron-sulfur proteins family profile domain-containing protein n=2 Tax=Acidocellaceae TaxID=3385905 RepID=F0J298_ACIMA|nr:MULTISPECIES: hypothetical protein [Acidiphilium]KDM67129.1 high-potential iron-sulfur protein [Acidiphilium sp. JA12-A1]MDE2327605.1 hypothetical protein [Rhodospirillales bacterium]UNC13808.1 hypothetical protein FE249_05945 [Acidiphilium multivorum]BAJ81842.1 hypothetical protein ACMV_24950 [Acidiphilium multivorum AIU301]
MGADAGTAPQGRSGWALRGLPISFAAADMQSKASARYVPHPGPGGADCAVCQFYEPAHPGAPTGNCMVVAGLVGARGYCDFFTSR